MAVYNGTFLPDIYTGTNSDDVINGNGGLDILSGGGGNDVIDGGAGDDVLNGNDGDDVLIGGVGAASILSFYNGGAGNDTMIGSPDGVAENFNGGDGTDTVSFEQRNRAVDARLDVESLPLLDSIIAVENLIGTRFNDTLTGNAQANWLSGGAGVDTILGGGGNDVLVGGLGADVLNGGAGIDSASYEDNQGAVSIDLRIGAGYGNAAQGDTMISIENLIGSSFNDYLIGGYDDNRISGAGGDDVLIGSLGADVLVGGSGFDTASYEDNQGAVFVDLRIGQGFGNAAQGDTYVSIENITGSLFADVLIGDAGSNRIDGGSNADLLIGGLGADVLIGGEGIDTVSYEDQFGAVSVDLSTGRGFGNAADGDTYFGIENAVGSLFDDTLRGDGGVNRLDGRAGQDLLIGGGGSDTFVFSADPGRADTILDFVSGTDLIELSTGAFQTLAAGRLAANAFVTGTQAGDADDRIIYDAATGRLLYDADGSGSEFAAFQFAQLQPGTALAASDFVIA